MNSSLFSPTYRPSTVILLTAGLLEQNYHNVKLNFHCQQKEYTVNRLLLSVNSGSFMKLYRVPNISTFTRWFLKAVKAANDDETGGSPAAVETRQWE
jgi:hypothetical protein